MIEGRPPFLRRGRTALHWLPGWPWCSHRAIATYMVLSVYSVAVLQRARVGIFGHHGEVLSGALVGAVFAFWRGQ